MEQRDLKTLIEDEYGTIYQFVMKTSFKRSTIYKILNGSVCNPTAKHIDRFVETLGCSYEEVHNAIKATNSLGHRDDRTTPETRPD